MIATYTIAQGQRVALWDRRGRRALVDGPRRVSLWGRRVEPLSAHVAGPGEYLVVRHRDGRVVHVPGPASLWFDPVEHAAVDRAPAVTLDANEAIVVYRRGEDGIDRRVVRGPARFVPTAEEWLHPFSWHGTDPAKPDRKVPRALRFTKLRVIPDQMYFDVADVRTVDDALLTVRLMVFFELMDIGVMLDQTHDPVADFINAVTADVIDHVGGCTFDAFKERTAALNDLATYKQLAGRAGRIGYRINKVVYRGYHATAKLQAMHDGAIEARTQLRLAAETERQAQDLADLKLARERERAAQRQQIQQAEAEHQRLLDRLAHEEKLRQQTATAAVELQTEQERHAAALRHAEARDRQRASFLAAVQALQVDMTRYLVARQEKPDRRIRVDGSAARRVHLHGAC
jgi:hypothetical protein